MLGSKNTIFRKGLLLVGMPIAFQLVLLAFLLHLQAESNEAEYWGIHTKDVMGQTEEVYRLITEAVSQMRGAIITGDPNFSPESARVGERVLPALDKLEHLVADNPPQVLQVRGFRARVVEILKWVDGERALVAAGKTREAAALVANLGGERSLQPLRDQLHAILDQERRLDHERLDRLAAIRRQGYWFVGAAAVVTVGMAALVLRGFSRGIASRLAVLADNAARLADRKPLASMAQGSDDEIGRVDRAFRDTAARLADADAAEDRHRAELERRAGDLAGANAELARANEDLRFKTQEIETFVYSVSHDLRSPLVNLQGFGKELTHACSELRVAATAPDVPGGTSRRMAALIDGDILESVRFIQTAVSRSGSIIDALLRLSRAGRVEYKRQRVNVRSVVGGVVDAMQSNLRERNVEVIVDDLPDTEADPTAIDQVFANLLDNAVNYLDPRRPGRIEVGTLAAPDDDGKLVRYFVRDNGLGIPAAYLPKMFVAFQRLHGQIAPGEGVGLALVRRVVERLGGSISVESTEGVGSTFFVVLPAAEETAGAGERFGLEALKA